ncbi:Spindle pole body-associated protein Vik1/Cik1, microtubule binding domain [Sesbania bispinosa]|nr:Spindle pole body-associated protein Vik1/Cik1, microtubule binding domain [Sesbania bispinosa]
MAAEAALSFSVASVVEDVLQQHGPRLKDLDLQSRKAEEAASRRYEAAGWLRKMVGVVAAKDLPEEPSEEEFRLGLRSGIILCNVINKVQSGAVPKVVESPVDSALIPDGAPLSAYQYFENVRNFLVAVQEIGLPTFEASDLEQGGKSSRIVNCVLALKSYSEWKQNGANGAWKFGGTLKPTISAKSFVRKNSEPFTNSLSRTSSINEKSLATLNSDVESNKMVDKKPEEIPMLVESVLNKVVEEFEHRIASQDKITSRDSVPESNGSVSKFVMADKKVDNKTHMVTKKEDYIQKNRVAAEELQSHLLKQQTLFDQQQRDVQELKLTLHTTKSGMQLMQKKLQEEFSNLGMHIHGLAHAASGYHRVLEENRKLYNEVQDLKGSIRVYCRVRPFFPGQANQLSTVENIEDGTITINVPSKNGKGRRSFNFNKVFGPSATQAEVFFDMQPLIRSVLDGYNVCIFAYGQTGSGKTHTMTGPKEITEKSQGSERVDKSEATGDRLKEAQHINKSLSALGDVIASLAQKNSHVPYRNSKLTQLLQDSLGGQAKTLMFVHISPETDAIGETISTLKFAERVATVELGAARVNKDSADVKELKETGRTGKKEGESEHSLSSSSDKYRTKASNLSPYHINQQVADTRDPLGCRRPMVEVGNIDLQSNTTLRHKTQSFDFDEISANSPPWPPVNNVGQNYGEDDKETGSGEWVDKVMVNKTENLLGCWQASNGNLSEAFIRNISKILPKCTQNSLTLRVQMTWMSLMLQPVIPPNLTCFGNLIIPNSPMEWDQDYETCLKGSKKPDLREECCSFSSWSFTFVEATIKWCLTRTGRHPASVDVKRKTGSRK